MTTSLAEQAYLHLRDEIITLKFAPGDPVRDADVSARLAIGRTPVREALKRLESDDLVVTYPRRGTFTTRVDITDLTNITEVRRVLEPVAAEAAAQRLTPTSRDTLDGLLTRLGEPLDPLGPDELIALDMRLHRALYAATRNPHLEGTLIHYDNLATRIWCLFTSRLPAMAEHVSEHAALLTAVLDGRGADAAALSRHHLEHFEQAIRAQM